MCNNDIYLWKQCVQTVDLLFLLDKSIILCDSLQCKLFHQVNLIWTLQMPFLQNEQSINKESITGSCMIPKDMVYMVSDLKLLTFLLHKWEWAFVLGKWQFLMKNQSWTTPYISIHYSWKQARYGYRSICYSWQCTGDDPYATHDNVRVMIHTLLMAMYRRWYIRYSWQCAGDDPCATHGNVWGDDPCVIHGNI